MATIDTGHLRDQLVNELAAVLDCYDDWAQDIDYKMAYQETRDETQKVYWEISERLLDRAFKLAVTGLALEVMGRQAHLFVSADVGGAIRTGPASDF